MVVVKKVEKTSGEIFFRVKSIVRIEETDAGYMIEFLFPDLAAVFAIISSWDWFMFMQ